MRRAALLLGAALALLLAALCFKGGLITLPSASEPGAFNTERAMARLRRILGDERPHPVDSAASDAVRARLIAELRAIGLTPRVTDEMACNSSPRDRGVSCARVRNVIASFGPAQGQHVLLVSHYDSTPVGPGASDDGIGVAAMLEAAAVLKGQRLQRPVSLLFTEGEEAGLLGARAFLDRDPLAARVDSVVNLEARGVTGPAIMFETNQPNGAAISAFARAARRPVANSLTTDFYRLIPNSTDVAVFSERNWTILNFAVIGNETRYHSPGDNLAALDRRSLKHMGEQSLAVTEQLSNGAPGGAGTKLYADLLGRALVVLPGVVGWAALAALLGFFAWVALRRRGGLGLASATVVAALVDAAILSFIGQWLVGLFRPGEYWRAFPEAIGAAVYVSAIVAALAGLLWLARPIARDRLRAALWLIFLLIGAGISLAAPGAAIFFLLPPLAVAAGIVAERRLAGAELAGSLLAWLLLFLSWAPLLHLSEELLDFDVAWAFAPVAALILFPALIELKPLLNRVPRKALTAALALGFALAWAVPALTPAYSKDRKQRFTIEYAWNQPEQRAQWLIYHDGGALPAAFKSIGPFQKDVEVPWSTRQRWATPAGGPAVPAPLVERLAERRTRIGRLLTLRLQSRGAEVVRLRAEPEAQLRSIRASRSMRVFRSGEADEDYMIRCQGRSCDGLVMELLVGSPKPVEFTVIGTRNGFPPQGKPLVAARPAEAAPQYAPDSTIAVDRVRF